MGKIARRATGQCGKSALHLVRTPQKVSHSLVSEGRFKPSESQFRTAVVVKTVQHECMTVDTIAVPLAKPSVTARPETGIELSPVIFMKTFRSKIRLLPLSMGLPIIFLNMAAGTGFAYVVYLSPTAMVGATLALLGVNLLMQVTFLCTYQRVVVDSFYREVRVESCLVRRLWIKQYIVVSRIDTGLPGLIVFEQGTGPKQRTLSLREGDFSPAVWESLQSCVAHFYDPVTRHGTPIPSAAMQGTLAA